MNKTALKTLIQGLEHRLELASKKKEEEKDLFGEMSYHFVMAGLHTAIEDAKKLLDLEKEQMKLAYNEDRPFLTGYETGKYFEQHYKENYNNE
jgi:hypothetical protein